MKDIIIGFYDHEDRYIMILDMDRMYAGNEFVRVEGLEELA